VWVCCGFIELSSLRSECVESEEPFDSPDQQECLIHTVKSDSFSGVRRLLRHLLFLVGSLILFADVVDESDCFYGVLSLVASEFVGDLFLEWRGCFSRHDDGSFWSDSERPECGVGGDEGRGRVPALSSFCCLDDFTHFTIICLRSSKSAPCWSVHSGLQTVRRLCS
jgi:hypothetical protein